MVETCQVQKKAILVLVGLENYMLWLKKWNVTKPKELSWKVNINSMNSFIDEFN